MAPTTPTGSRTTSELPISSSQGKASAAWAASAKAPAGSPTCTPPDRVMGMPTSCEMMVAISSVRAARASPMRMRALALSSREVVDQAGKAAAAASTAALTSSTVPSGMVAMTSSVVESMTSRVPVPVEGTQRPLMYSLSRTSMLPSLAVPVTKTLPVAATHSFLPSSG